MKTIAQWIEHGQQALMAAGVHFGHGTDNARDEAAWLVLHVLGQPLDGAFRNWSAPVTADAAGKIRRLLERRIAERRPLAYLLGEAWFCGLRFEVNESVLVPRSPLAEMIQADFQPWAPKGSVGEVLDLCTGSGCIAIAIARHMPETHVDAVDISAAALEVAARNVALHEVGNRVRLLQSNLFSALAGQRYDLIVSNPPYVSDSEMAALPDEYGWEPRLGLRAAMNGLELAVRILRDASAHLTQGGLLVCEVGEAAGRLQELLPKVPFIWPEFAHGGGGVFTIRREALLECGPQFAQLPGLT